MYFDLTDDQKHLTYSVERVLADLIDLGRLANAPDAVDDARAQVDASLGRIGVPLVLAPEDHGGIGLGLLGLVAVSHGIGRHCAPTGIVDTALAAWLIATYGTPTQRDRWLAPLLASEIGATFALNEAPGDWAPGQWKANATAAAAIEKQNVRPAGPTDLLIVGTADGLAIAEGGSATFAPATSPLDPTTPLARMTLPGSALEPLSGMDAARRLFSAMLVLSAADAAGTGQRALAMTVEYAKTRYQFDQPIGSFQAVKHQLAQIAVDIEPAHFPCWYAAHAWDRADAETPRAAMLAKAHAADMAVKAGRAAVEIHGGIAYTWEYPLHLLLKRAMRNKAILGTPAALRRMIAALDDAPVPADASAPDASGAGRS